MYERPGIESIVALNIWVKNPAAISGTIESMIDNKLKTFPCSAVDTIFEVCVLIPMEAIAPRHPTGIDM